ncbi:MAG: hypothetical protein AAF242_00385 [Bacteroidota bacterium]
MKFFKFLVLLSFLCTAFLTHAQIYKTNTTIKKQRKPLQSAHVFKNICKNDFPLNLSTAVVLNGTHQATNLASLTISGNRLIVRNISNRSITEQDHIWVSIPFKPGYPSSYITGLEFKYNNRTYPNRDPRHTFISQHRISQGPSPFQGAVRLDNAKNLHNSGMQLSRPAYGKFACGSNYKTVSFKVIMNAGDAIEISNISIIFDCSIRPQEFQCPPHTTPDPLISLDKIIPESQFKRYHIDVNNYASFPNYLFELAPTLPSCGLNNHASRSWVEIVDENYKKLNGYCAMQKSADLAKLSFIVKYGKPLPKRVRIIIRDRACNGAYRSNWINLP